MPALPWTPLADPSLTRLCGRDRRNPDMTTTIRSRNAGRRRTTWRGRRSIAGAISAGPALGGIIWA
jgi:hypothetical protein